MIHIKHTHAYRKASSVLDPRWRPHTQNAIWWTVGKSCWTLGKQCQATDQVLNKCVIWYGIIIIIFLEPEHCSAIQWHAQLGRHVKHPHPEKFPLNSSANSHRPMEVVRLGKVHANSPCTNARKDVPEGKTKAESKTLWWYFKLQSLYIVDGMVSIRKKKLLRPWT